MADREALDADEARGDNKRFQMNRRNLLKAVGGMAGISGVSGFAARHADAATSYDFTTTVDLANYANGGDRIDSILADLAADNTLIEVPDQTYVCGSIDFGGVEHFGISAKDNATPTFESPGQLGGNWFNYSGRNILIEGITFDHNGATEGTVNLQMPGPWECRDVHHKGKLTTSAFRMAVTDSGSTGLLKGCSATDGGVDNDRSRGGFVPSEHVGELTIEDVDIRNFSDNGLYGSPGAGQVNVIRGFFKNNNISGVRVGMSATVRDVVVVNDELAPSNSARNQRGIWLRDRGSGSVTVENCDVTHTSGDDSHPILVEGGDGSVSNCRVRNDTSAAAINPGGSYTGSGNHISGTGDLSAPDSWVACVDNQCDEPRTTAREEDSTTEDDSGNDTGGDTDLPNDVTIDGANAEEDFTEYSFTVDGELSGTDSLNSKDTVDGSSGSGIVYSGADGYKFSGDIVSFERNGDAAVYVNGTEVDSSSYGEADDPEQTLTIDGSNAEEDFTEYTFTVDGELSGTDLLNSKDTVDGSSGSGIVYSGVDEYVFTGDIVSFERSGDAVVLVDGEQLDMSQFDSGSAPTIDRYDVTEAGSRNVDANITAVWSVSDEDGDLSDVTVETLDDSGTVVDSASNAVSGDQAYDVNYFRLSDVDGQTLEVQMTVTDSEGNQSSASQTVQE